MVQSRCPSVKEQTDLVRRCKIFHCGLPASVDPLQKSKVRPRRVEAHSRGSFECVVPMRDPIRSIENDVCWRYLAGLAETDSVDEGSQ